MLTRFYEDTTKGPLPTKFLLLIQMRWTMPISTKPGGQEQGLLSKETGVEQDVLNPYAVALAEEQAVGLAVEQEEVVVVRTGGVGHSVPAVTI